MDFAEKMKELIAGGAGIHEIASSFGLDVKVLPHEWILFISNSIMLTFSMMAQLESFNVKMEGMNEKVDALSEMCAMDLYMLYIEDKEKALNAYNTRCSIGGSKSYPEILASAGLEPSYKEGKVKAVMEKVKEYLNNS